MTVTATYSPGPNAEDITIEKDGGILKEIITEAAEAVISWKSTDYQSLISRRVSKLIEGRQQGQPYTKNCKLGGGAI